MAHLEATNVAEFAGAFRGTGVVYFRVDVSLDENVDFVRISSLDFAS